MRQDIVKLLEAEKDVTNVVVLTHNIDFVFIQSVVLPALRRCGHPSLTIFADAQCAVESYQHQHLVLDSLGTRFRVVPVAMRPGFRFHPKAILLSGQKKGVLLVGSGNLTFGGWRENAETWCRFDSDLDGTAQFTAFLDYLGKVVGLTPLRGYLEAEIHECFDGRLRPWAQDMEPAGGLLGRPSMNAPLIDQMQTALQGKPIVSLLAHSPYFDDGGRALRELSARFDVKVKVAAQWRRSGLPMEAATALAEKIDVNTVNFQHRTIEGKFREAFIHAKWYAFEHADSYSVFLGSANCSQAALTISGAAGNAELMAYVTLGKEEFAANFTGELEFLEVDPQLTTPVIIDTQNITPPPLIHISAASVDQGCLQVVYSCAQEVALQALVVDGQQQEFAVAAPGVIIVNGVSHVCQSVCLQGITGSKVVFSNLHWVDHEQALSTTARSRSVVDAVRTKVQSQSWNIGAWSEIANVFLRNLQYMPARMATGRVVGAGATRERAGQNHYTAEDVFSDHYGLPAFSQMSAALSDGSSDRVTSLRQLLMRWFGYKDEAEGDSAVEDPQNDDVDDVVDRPEVFPPTATPSARSTPQARVVTESDRRRAMQILKMVSEQMSSESYLRERLPETLSVDIQFASVLLRAGLCEGWITEEEFFASTHQIWAPLFFTSGPEPTCGWLEYRQKTSDDPGEFAKKLLSPKLTAALAAWIFAIPEGVRSPEHSRFYLAKLLSVARLPWLWHYENGTEIAKELQVLLVSSTDTRGDRFWEETEAKWVSMMRCGHALRLFQEALAQKTPDEMRGQITQQKVTKGELLWQGTGGLCVAVEDINRAASANAEILYLQRRESRGLIKSAYAIPLKGLLSCEGINLSEAPKKTLLTMLENTVISV